MDSFAFPLSLLLWLSPPTSVTSFPVSSLFYSSMILGISMLVDLLIFRRLESTLLKPYSSELDLLGFLGIFFIIFLAKIWLHRDCSNFFRLVKIKTGGVSISSQNNGKMTIITSACLLCYKEDNFYRLAFIRKKKNIFFNEAKEKSVEYELDKLEDRI